MNLWPFKFSKLPASPARSVAIVDARLHVCHDLLSALARNSHFFADTGLRGHFASQLLLYETLLIPTNDMAVVPALVSWLGLPRFEEVLEADTLRFLRRRGLLGYAGNGNGISEFTVEEGEAGPMTWWQESLFGPTERAIELQIRHGIPSLDRKYRSRLIQQITERTETVVFENPFFIKNIAHESYTDVLKSPEHRGYLQKELPAGTFNLQSLPQVPPNQIVVASLEPFVTSPVDLLLKVADLNVNVALADRAGGADFLVPSGAEKLLRAKIDRSPQKASLVECFASLLDLRGLPDVRAAVSTDSLDLGEIWKLRQKKHARKFREWLRNANPTTTRDLERLYVEALG